MSVEIRAERRLLSEDELGQVSSSHYPDLTGLGPDDTLALARWLRGRRDRIRDIIAARRRARRGKAAGAGIESAQSSERGLAAKKQVFARALRRVNARLDRFRAERRREAARVNLADAVARKRAGISRHPSAGRTARRGMQPLENTRADAVLEGSTVGRASQSVRDAQAKRDA